MPESNGTANGNGHAVEKSRVGTWAVKAGMAKMLKGGVIMDVMNVEQAKIAEGRRLRRHGP